jgi:uncharacterized tellurite resistance protein B-like protein
MMSIQAREHHSRHIRASAGLRPYPVDSPRAKARLLVLAMIADGKLDSAELETLMGRGAFAELGITRNEFLDVLYEFGADLAGLPNRGFDVAISPGIVQSLLAEVADDTQKLAMLRLIFDVIRSDGELAPGEARLFWTALDAWSLRVEDGRRHGSAGKFRLIPRRRPRAA